MEEKSSLLIQLKNCILTFQTKDMCFRIKIDKKLTAKRDILCYKIVCIDVDNNILPLYYMDKPNSYFYKFGETVKSELNITAYHAIERGFHSFIKPNIANYYIKLCTYFIYTDPDHNNDFKLFHKEIKIKEIIVVSCIIPKGAHYYVNDEEYVSDQIKLIEILK